ncbi:MAG: hypothetical protein WB988_17550 [Candidatus Nitrosopolaris sp.]|jgi:hypothetical protein
MPNPDFLYDDIGKSFASTLDRSGKGNMEDGNQRRREITLHSFRRFVKTTISDLGYADFSEWFIGNSGSTYWTKKDSEKAEIFRKIEHYLTFLNIPQLERRGADIQSKVEELEQLNQSMRDRDKTKDDAIAHLSDQLIAGLFAILQDGTDYFRIKNIPDNAESREILRSVGLEVYDSVDSIKSSARSSSLASSDRRSNVS